MRSTPPPVLVLGCAVWKELGGGRGTVDGRVVAECVEDAPDGRGPELGRKAMIAPTTPSRITPATRRHERGDPNPSIKICSWSDASARCQRESWYRPVLAALPP
jgi:hypothetical protein